MKKYCLLLAAISSAACTLPKMAVKPELAPGAQEPFAGDIFGRAHVRFGQFAVADVDRSPFEGSSTRTSSILFPNWLKSLGEIREHQDYAFELSEGGQSVRSVRCRADLTATEANMGRLKMTSSDERLHCAWVAGEGTELGRLDLANGSGEIAFAGHTLPVEARDLRGDKSSISPAGFAIVDGPRELATFQVVNGGAAWIAPDLDPARRTAIAAAGAALLLYQPPPAN